MSVRRVGAARNQAHEHAHQMPLGVGREQLGGNAGSDLFPGRLDPLRRVGHHRLAPGFRSDAVRKAGVERSVRAQHVGRPGAEHGDDRQQDFQLALAERAGRDVGFRGRHLAVRQRPQGIGAGELGLGAAVGFRAAGDALAQLVQPGADAGLHPAERLVARRDRFGARERGAIRSLDLVALVRPQSGHRGAQLFARLPRLIHLGGSGAGACQVHDPRQHRALRRVVSQRAAPHVHEHFERQLFRGLAVRAQPHDDGEDRAVRPLIQAMQRGLVAARDAAHERNPVALGLERF